MRWQLVGSFLKQKGAGGDPGEAGGGARGEDGEGVEPSRGQSVLVLAGHGSLDPGVAKASGRGGAAGQRPGRRVGGRSDPAGEAEVPGDEDAGQRSLGGR